MGMWITGDNGGISPFEVKLMGMVVKSLIVMSHYSFTVCSMLTAQDLLKHYTYN